MKLVYNIFRGIRPRQSPRSLPTGYAQTATNVRALSDDLESWREPGEEQTLAKGGVIRSLFLMARQYWLHWTEEVEVARGPIPPGTDDSERTYITGLDRPRIGPKEYEAIVEWRTRLGHHVASGTPAEALLVTKGVKAAMAIKGVMPKTTCFLQVRVPRHPHYLSLKLPRSST